MAEPLHACETPQQAGYVLWQVASESEVDSDDSVFLAIDSISVGAISELFELFGDPLLLKNGNISQRSGQFPDALNAPKTARPNSADGSDSDGRDEADSDLNPLRCALTRLSQGFW